jgi:hypothetical protein
MLILGIKEKGRRHYWKMFFATLLKNSKLFSLFITLAIQGFHFRKVAEKIQLSPVQDVYRIEQAIK